jgi:hypothetical protein
MNTPIYILFECTLVHRCEPIKIIYLNNTYIGTYPNKICTEKFILLNFPNCMHKIEVSTKEALLQHITLLTAIEGLGLDG